MLTNVDKHNILNNVVDARVSYIGNTPAFQAGKVGSIPIAGIMRKQIRHRFFEVYAFFVI